MVKLRFIISRSLLVIFGTVFTLLLLEVLLRVVALPTIMELNRQQLPLWQSDPELLLHLRPNLDVRITAHPDFNYTIRTNEDGLRDETLDGPVDIAAIGDSFTFGFGVDEEFIWPTKLETLSEAQVANLGWLGWNSHVYPSTIKRHAIPLNARIWIWTFYINDLKESAGAYEFLSSGKGDYLAQSASGVVPPFPYNLRIIELLLGVLNPQAVQFEEFANSTFEEDGRNMRLSRNAWKASDPQSVQVRQGWELTEAALLEAQALAAEHGATLLLVHAPAREHVYWPIVQDAMPDVDVAQLDDVANRLAAFAGSHEILFLDLLPGFRAEAEQGTMLYFPADGHWNAAGNGLAAQLIYEILREENLLS